MNKIVLDLDDVLCDFVPTWCKWLYAKGITKTELTRQDIKTYDHFQLFGKEANDFYIKNPDESYNEWINPLEGSHEFVEWCENNFDEVMILSHATHKNSQNAKKAFVRKHFNIKNINFSSSVIEKYNFTQGCILIDDYPLNVLKHVQHNNAHGITFNRDRMNPWSSINCHPEFVNSGDDINFDKYWELCSYEQIKQVLHMIRSYE